MAAINAPVASGNSSYLIARQPIVDSGLKLVGYELLYRDQLKQSALDVSGDTATARVISISLGEAGLDALTGEALAFINMTREAILNTDLLSLPPHRVVLEILEDIEIDALLQRKIDRLIDRGYRFALDDFVLEGLHDRHINLASLVKLDVRALSRTQLEAHVSYLRRFRVKLVAEKVETWEEFEFCRQLGFDLFQGYFFARPQLISGRSLCHSRETTWRLITRLNDPAVDFDELERLVSQDPGLAMKLFRYVNSAMLGKARTFSNLRQVIIMLGTERLRAVATLFTMCKMDSHPQALVILLLQRAQLCRLLAERDAELSPEDAFTVGIFSLMDTFMGHPLAEILLSIPLPVQISQAVMRYEGRLGALLKEVEALERHSGQPGGELSDTDLLLYTGAVQWAQDTVGLLDSSS